MAAVANVVPMPAVGESQLGSAKTWMAGAPGDQNRRGQQVWLFPLEEVVVAAT